MSNGTRALRFRRRYLDDLVLIVVSGIVIGTGGCTQDEPPAPPVLTAPAAPTGPIGTTKLADERAGPLEVASVEIAPQPAPMPSAMKPTARDNSMNAEEIPLFAANSPFDTDYEAPTVKQEKRLWARSFRWAKAPDFVVEKWLTDEPDMKGKYVLIEFWATWCAPCRRSIPLLNRLHRTYCEELVVIGISDEAETEVLAMEDPRIDFFSAVDTQGRMKNELGVLGIPHAIILEPDGYVIWEGFPLLEGYELTEEIIEKILEVGRKLKAESGSG